MIPVTVLTGFLGAGKTTLLNRILTEQHGRKIAVIENEFGEVGVDNHLVIQADEEIFAMNNGCICCTVRGDLIRILQKLAQRDEPIEAVLIETTGLADPGPVAQTFFTDPEIRARYRLDAIVTVVDARHIVNHWDESDEAKKQIAFADVILLNKVDLVPAEALDVVETRIRRMNPAARLHRTTHAELPLEYVIGVGGFNLDRATRLDPKFLEPEYPFEWGGVYELPTGRYEWVMHEGPDPEMDLVFLPVAATAASDIETSRDAAVLAFSEKEAAALRSGDTFAPDAHLRRLLLSRSATADDTAVVPPAEPHADGGTGSVRSARSVFPVEITTAGRYALFTQHHPDEFHAGLRDRDGMRESLWSHAFKPNHEHDEAVGSVGITLTGDMDAARLNAWLGELLRTKGTDIFRSKGVLSVHGQERRLVFQGVHMMFDGKYDRPWAGEPRVNSFVFIGRRLERAALVEGFKACLVN